MYSWLHPQGTFLLTSVKDHSWIKGLPGRRKYIKCKQRPAWPRIRSWRHFITSEKLTQKITEHVPSTTWCKCACHTHTHTHTVKGIRSSSQQFIKRALSCSDSQPLQTIQFSLLSCSSAKPFCIRIVTHRRQNRHFSSNRFQYVLEGPTPSKTRPVNLSFSSIPSRNNLGVRHLKTLQIYPSWPV